MTSHEPTPEVEPEVTPEVTDEVSAAPTGSTVEAPAESDIEAATEAPAAPAAPTDAPVEAAADTEEPASAEPAAAEPEVAPTAAAVPTPGPARTPAAAAEPSSPAATTAPSGSGDDTQPWGRVDDDGTVHVRTADGERAVGQYAAGSPDEALAFFTRRFDSLAAEVDLLERRVASGVVSPEEAAESVRTVKAQVDGANAVGDLAGLLARLDALAPAIASQRQAKREEKAARQAEAAGEKEKVVAQAEKLAEADDWRNGANRLRDLLEEWKALPRLDRATDDALWKRFSTARTTYTRRRKTHFSQQNEKRDGARVVKERLVKEAEALSGSTEWGPTAGKYRDLMRDWKAAGPAPKDVDDALWKRFRDAQDTFFGARDASNAALDAEFAGNAEIKDKLIVEAEQIAATLQSGGDLGAAKRAYRDIADRWEAAGKVPRDRIKELDGRIRKVEQTLRTAEDAQWKASDPEKAGRADDMVAKLETAIAKVEADLDQARAAGDDRKVRDLEENLTSRRAFLDMARKASADYRG